MDIRRLEIFCRVIESKSFTRAADAVHLTQPTVSENVRLLEEAVGERLLDRLGREVLPTPAGRILYGYARRMLQLRDEAIQALAEYRGALSGELVFGASTIPGAYLLPRIVAAFRADHPDIRITLRIAGSDRILDGLLHNEWELGLVGAPARDPRLECRELPGDRLVLAVPPGHRWASRSSVPPAELAGEGIILREKGSGTRRVLEAALKSAGFDPAALAVIAEMGSSEAVRQAVKSSLGIAVLSSLAVAEDLADGRLHGLSLEGVAMKRPFFIVRCRGRQLSPLAQTFRQRLEELEEG
jgi:DNA-binding transcriptional LysR family regulator